MYENCSVIEDATAYEVIRMISERDTLRARLAARHRFERPVEVVCVDPLEGEGDDGPHEARMLAQRKPKFGILAGEPEILGERCADGGKCHHMCDSECFRKDGCVPLSGSGLTDDWQARAALERKP